jgi:ubiquinone/menaquinone biosynthesis C-methylase UbiE
LEKVECVARLEDKGAHCYAGTTFCQYEYFEKTSGVNVVPNDSGQAIWFSRIAIPVARSGYSSTREGNFLVMSTDNIQSKKLLTEYTALAPSYDRRWSAYLDASLAMTLKRMADLPAEHVLDVACGTGQLLALMAQRTDESELIGIDRVPAMLEVASRRLGDRATFLAAEAQHLPFGDARFQLVTTTNALHYFPDASGVLREIRRVISPDGDLIITDWCRNYVWMKILNRVLPWTQHAHVHTFTTNELNASLSEAGFRIVSNTRWKIDWFWGLMTVRATPN